MIEIKGLGAEQATDIVGLFERVYGDTYANELFYDAQALNTQIASRQLSCVGAYLDSTLVGHMAMSLQSNDGTPELGNTVVDPEARGEGVAWKVGAELTSWCKRLGYEGFLHYPTTDHHIMQRQSVKSGFETGLMLSYIPSETNGKVNSVGKGLRGAATIVYEPLASATAQRVWVPETLFDVLESLTTSFESNRSMMMARPAENSIASIVETSTMLRRGLRRIKVHQVGADLLQHIGQLTDDCLQIDFRMDDVAIANGVELATEAGFRFCGWLPGFMGVDVLRMQKVSEIATDFHPTLENETARFLLGLQSPP